MYITNWFLVNIRPCVKQLPCNRIFYLMSKGICTEVLSWQRKSQGVIYTGSKKHWKSTGSYMYSLLYLLYCTQKGMDSVWSHVAISWHKGLCFIYWWVGVSVCKCIFYWPHPGWISGQYTYCLCSIMCTHIWSAPTMVVCISTDC